MDKQETKVVLSRHRLPLPYRAGLAAAWLLPPVLLLLALLYGGLTPSGFDLRLGLLFGLMCAPALYIWREGVDVLPGGLVARVFWPRYLPYERLDAWYFDGRADRRVLTIWSLSGTKALECRAGHLTNFPALLAALKANIRCRRWPA
ncbi:MAG: hypothetical protein DWB42_16105 [Chloroflexi bacterium]|jgi:hypothetical protein|nr:hypothetical protein [Chloroflexota bacterium]MDL1883873.1 hypothetical protein [Anaerolineae bacterium CFX8]